MFLAPFALALNGAIALMEWYHVDVQTEVERPEDVK